MSNDKIDTFNTVSEGDQTPSSEFAPNKRNTKDIFKMIQRQKNCQDVGMQPQISYEEACEHYKFYKSRTLKANAQDPDFEQNMTFRQFFLGIKKRYDMQYRAQKFRSKQKEEIAQLKRAVQEKCDRSCEDVVSSLNGQTFGDKLEQNGDSIYKS